MALNLQQVVDAVRLQGWAVIDGYSLDSIRQLTRRLGWSEVPTRRGDPSAATLRPTTRDTARPASLPTGQEQHSIEDLAVDVTEDQRWEFEGPIPFLYVSIQGGDENTYVTCRILMDDQVLAENSSDAPYGVASCQVA